MKGAPSKESIQLETAPPKKADSENAPIETAEAADVVDQSNDEELAQPAPPIDDDLEETQLEETQIEETPQPVTEEPAAMEDDEEPLEWEESDRE